MRPTRSRYLIALCAIAAAFEIAGAQGKPPVAPADYGKFETLVMPPRALSPDGRWFAYGINRSSRQNELRIARVDAAANTAPTVVAFASQAAFSADSRWVAYGIGYPEAQEEKLRQQKKPIHRKAGILNLASGETTTVDGVESFAFNATGSHLAMKRYAPERKDPGETPPPSDEESPAGATLIVRELATGRDTTFGNVTEFTWQEKGGLLAFTIGAEDKTGNGVQLFDPSGGALRVLDSANATYSGLTWRKDANDLAVLRAKPDDRRDGASTWCWPGKSHAERRHAYDPTAARDFPAGLRIVSYRRPSWSDDGRMVFVGVAKWNEKVKEAPKPAGDHGNGAAPERCRTKSLRSPRPSTSGTPATST